jgi:hypothetical protein
MRVLSTVSRLLLVLFPGLGLVSVTSCGTSAKGIDDCREIEQARCSAARNCEQIDVDECQRFYRDQCLHGLPVSPPSPLVVKACVATIVAAGVCAMQGANTAPSACDPPPSGATSAQTVCEIVQSPEKTSECSFLAPLADAGSGGNGGTDGATPASTAGAAGTAGSDG